MGEFFGSLYTSLFENFFGLDLANYLWGQTSQSGTNLYIGIGLWLLGISLAVAIIFYYVIDHPKLNNWWGWLIFTGINAIINFIVGLEWTLTDLYAGKMVQLDPRTNQWVDMNITSSDCICFGVTNAILSIVIFFIISMIIKWKSKSVSHAPF